MNPWTQFEQASCLPDNCQCELTRDALIRHPSAFWSSLAYIIAAWAIYREIANKSLELKLWAGVCALMGFSSLFGHASFINFALAMDFASIILVLSFFALLNLLLLLKQSIRKILIYLFIYYVCLFVAMYYMNKWAKIGFCLLIFAFSMGDVIRETGWRFLKARTLQLSLLVLFFSFGMFIVDEMHLGCEPEAWFQWHSMWHIGTAISMYYYGKWRFTSDGTDPAR